MRDLAVRHEHGGDRDEIQHEVDDHRVGRAEAGVVEVLGTHLHIHDDCDVL